MPKDRGLLDRAVGIDDGRSAHLGHPHRVEQGNPSVGVVAAGHRSAADLDIRESGQNCDECLHFGVVALPSHAAAYTRLFLDQQNAGTSFSRSFCRL